MSSMVLDLVDAGVTRIVMPREAELPSVRSEPLLDELRLLYGVLAYAPELNPSNIDHDDACALNAAMLEAFGLCRSILNRITSNARPHAEAVADSVQVDVGRDTCIR